MTVLVLGRSGQLATHLAERLPDAVFWGRDTFDLANPEGLADAIVRAQPSFIINAAGYTAVDKAESEPDAAWRLNADAPAMAARAAAALGVPLLHFSTDYVFDGSKQGDYLPDDATNPVSVYGRSKLGGELAVRALAPKSWVLRTSWVFSEHGANFVKTMLRLAASRPEVRVVADQRGRPTYAGDLARLAAAIAAQAEPEARLPWGIHHATGGDAVSWHAFAEIIFRRAHERGALAKMPVVHAIPTSDYPTPARRPVNSALAPSVELDPFGVRFDWSAGLAAALSRQRLERRD